jgi:F-type H+-transporting ATPase subunit b
MARRLTAAWFAAVPLVLALPGWAAAAEEKKPPGIFDPQFDLGLWTIVVFVLLFWVLRKWAWGPMLQGLTKREEMIRSALEEARVARAEAAHARADFQKKMDEAYAEIPKLMDQARHDAQALKEEMRTQAQQEIQTDRQRLRREIETAKDQAVQELFAQSANLATMLATRVIPHALTPDDHRRLVDQAMNEMKQAHQQG